MARLVTRRAAWLFAAFVFLVLVAHASAAPSKGSGQSGYYAVATANGQAGVVAAAPGQRPATVNGSQATSLMYLGNVDASAQQMAGWLKKFAGEHAAGLFEYGGGLLQLAKDAKSKLAQGTTGPTEVVAWQRTTPSGAVWDADPTIAAATTVAVVAAPVIGLGTATAGAGAGAAGAGEGAAGAGAAGGAAGTAGKVVSKAKGLLSGGGGDGSPSDSPQSYLRTSAIATGAAVAVGTIAHAVSRGTTADVTAGWFHGLYQRAAMYAAIVALLAFVCAVTEGASRGDGELVLAALRAVPYAAIVTFAATSIIALAIAAVDDAGELIAGSSLHDTTHVLHMLAGLFLALAAAAKGAAMTHHVTLAKIAAFPAAMFAIFGAIGGGLVALELLLREIAIYAGTLFLPLAMAARIWPRLAHAGTRLGQMLLAVILSKLVLVMMLGVCATAILHGGAKGLLVGAGGLVFTALAPAAAYAIFSLADHRFHGRELPRPRHVAAAGERMGELVGWSAEHADRVRGDYYQSRPDLQSPIADRGDVAPPPRTPPPDPPNNSTEE